jgi:hypothetical protein
MLEERRSIAGSGAVGTGNLEISREEARELRERVQVLVPAEGLALDHPRPGRGLWGKCTSRGAGKSVNGLSNLALGGRHGSWFGACTMYSRQNRGGVVPNGQNKGVDR